MEKAELCSHALHLFKLLSSPTNEKLEGCIISNWRPILFWVNTTTHSEKKPTSLTYHWMMKATIFHQAQTIHSFIGSERLPVHLLHFRRLVSASLRKQPLFSSFGNPKVLPNCQMANDLPIIGCQTPKLTLFLSLFSSLFLSISCELFLLQILYFSWSEVYWTMVFHKHHNTNGITSLSVP